MQSFYSSLEGAMKLKFVSFCSFSDVLLHGIIFCRNQAPTTKGIIELNASPLQPL